MVKIKEGYVMSFTERREYDRLNALPRKTDGRVDYYFKPVTKYPARIYVFMHAEIWCDRNRRPMGLYYSFPFLSRPMNQQEIEYHHFNSRLCYHQYESWKHLLAAESREAQQLDLERPGTGQQFLASLEGFQSTYSLKEDTRVSVINQLVKAQDSHPPVASMDRAIDVEALDSVIEPPTINISSSLPKQGGNEISKGRQLCLPFGGD